MKRLRESIDATHVVVTSAFASAVLNPPAFMRYRSITMSIRSNPPKSLTPVGLPFFAGSAYRRPSARMSCSGGSSISRFRCPRCLR